mgnify:CR=1 FL=1
MKPPVRPAEPNQEVERRRVPRVNLSHEQFRLASNGQLFWVTDLSLGGFGIRISEQQDLILFSLGKAVTGILNLHGEKLALEARVQHLARGFAGLEFQNLSGSSRVAIERFLDPSNLAQELQRMPAPEEALSWFHGPSGTDVLVWSHREDGSFERALVMLRGHYVEWEAGTPAQIATGTFAHSQDAPDVRGLMRIETLLFQRDGASPGAEKKIIAKKFLLSSNLPESLKKRLIARL